MSEKNDRPKFQLPFYKNEDKRFFNRFSSKVFYPSITTDLDFSETGRFESARSHKRLLERRLFGVVMTPEVVLFDGDPNEGGEAREGNFSMGLVLEENFDVDERDPKVGRLSARSQWDVYSRFEDDERLPTDSSLLLHWEVSSSILDEIEKRAFDSSVEMEIHFLLDIYRNDDGVFGMVGSSDKGVSTAEAIVELDSITLVKKGLDDASSTSIPKLKTRDWYKISTISLLTALFISQLLLLMK